MEKTVASQATREWRGHGLADDSGARPLGGQRQRPVRILLADDRRLCRECLRLLIESIDPDLEVVEVDSTDSIPHLVEKGSQPDVLLYNLVLTDSQGIDFVEKLSSSVGNVPLVVMCDKDDPELMRGCLEGGAKAFLPSKMPGPIFISVLNLVIAGGTYAPPDMLVNLSPGGLRSEVTRKSGVLREAAIAENFPMLTPRQKDVLALLSQGHSNRDIAVTLDMCENTVKAHVKQVMRKLKTDNRTQAALMADRLVG